MPLVYQQNINPDTRLGVWHIAEPEAFFTEAVPVFRAISHPHKRLQHLAGRFLLQQLFPQFPYNLVMVADTRKPYIPNDPYHFSIAHSGQYAAALVSTRRRTGVDIEAITPRITQVVHKFLSEYEQQLLNDCCAHHPNLTSEQCLTIAWSIKEALYKWYSFGGVDFIDHLHIHQLHWSANMGKARCSITVHQQVDLWVEVLLLEGYCLAWVFDAGV